MSIVNAYQQAMERLDHEKTAQAYIDTYGTSDGYLPENYFNAFVEFEKEAHADFMINTFAPDTGYIPAAYVEALTKEANILTSLGKGMKTTAQNIMGNTKNLATDIATKRKVLGSGATLGDKARFYGAKALGAASQNPALTVGAVGAGTLGTGMLAGNMMAR